MSSQVDRIVEVAERYIGIKENPPNSNNVIFNTRYYGKPVNDPGLAWCVALVWCLFQDIGAPELFYGGGKTASCTTLTGWAKQNGLWVTSGYQRGDFAMFDWSGQRKITQHIGLITEISSFPNVALTIEGNTSLTSNDNGGAVMRRTRAYSLITGAFRPNYEEDDMLTQEQFEAMFKVMVDKRGKLGPASTIAEAEYNRAVSSGITDGTRPQALVTRQESAVMAYRAAKK